MPSAKSKNMEELDCVVVGAGWYGLGAAKQYYVNHPDAKLAILDSAPALGGVWASHRLYPGLKSNNLVGTYEYPDFPMTEERFGVPPGKHIPGEVINKYQAAYAAHFGIDKLVRCRTRVLSAEHRSEGGWVLRIAEGCAEDGSGTGGKEGDPIVARRLIVATGLTSEPFVPRLEGQDEFGAPVFHARDFVKFADTVDPNKCKRVTILGGSKFAWDAVYAYATKGVEVDWVIRASGHGACWMSPPYVTPLKKWLEKLANTRLLTWFSPCAWADDDGYAGIRSFWHGTAVGRTITNTFWGIIGADVQGLCNLKAHPETAKLIPRTSAFHTSTSFSILNYDTDFFELVRSGIVRVHVADIARLSRRAVHLVDPAAGGKETVVPADALLLVTGWKHVPPLQFLPEGIAAELGVPHNQPEGGAAAADLAAPVRGLTDRADAEILTRFPRLGKVPVFNERYVPLVEQPGVEVSAKDAALAPSAPLTPFMLHRFSTPPQAKFLAARDIAFTGFSTNFSNVITAHVLGLWISAFFDGKLARDPSKAVGSYTDDASDDESGDKDVGKKSETALEELQYTTVLHNRMGKWRYPTDHGSKYPDFVFDAVPYLDMLLADLGLKVHRKKGWLSEALEPYGPEDYRDINEEWKLKYGS